MKRRTLLASLGATSVSVAGCVSTIAPSSSEDSSSDFEACGEPILVFSKLPDAVQREVETAFEEGEYHADGELLYEQVAGDSVQALRRNDFYYDSHIDKKLLGGKTLSFTQTTMTHDSPVDLEIRNTRDGDWKGTVKVTDVDGEILVLEENVTVESYPTDPEKRRVDLTDERIKQFSVTDEWGEYRISLFANQEEYDTYDASREDSYFLEGTTGTYGGHHLRVVLNEEGAELDDELGRESTEENNSSPEQPCLWNETNEVVMGSAE